MCPCIIIYLPSNWCLYFVFTFLQIIYIPFPIGTPTSDNMSNNSSDTDSSCFPTANQLDIIAWVSIGTGGVSLISCIVILFIAILFQKYRSTTQRVILYLAITVLLNSLLYMLHGIRTKVDGSKNGPFCTTVAFLDQVVNWMEFLAISCLTFDLFVKSVFLKFRTEKYELVYMIVIFILPFSFNWIPFIHNTYGFGGTNCWIKQYHDMDCSKRNNFGFALRFAIYWIPFYILMAIVIVAYFIAVIKARRRISQYSALPSYGEQAMKELLLFEVRQYRLYPFIMTFIFSLGIISRVAEAVNHTSDFFELRIFHVIVMAIQGPVIGIVFTLDYDTRKQIRNPQQLRAAFFGLCCACRTTRVKEYAAIVHDTPQGSLGGDPFMTPRQSGMAEEESLTTGSGNFKSSPVVI